MDPAIGRRTWRTLEPCHGAIYFVPEARREYEALGTTSRMNGYFLSRAAPMGAVSAEVVIGTFYNFEPGFVLEAFGDGWAIAGPAQFVDARLRAADAMMRRAWGDRIVTAEVAEAASLARSAAEVACGAPGGRPLFAGHAALDWPDEPHLVLWYAQTLLREFRGDGHIVALLQAGLDPCEALVSHAASGEVTIDVLQNTRRWSDEQWRAAAERLAERGLVDADGAFTAAGRAQRDDIEALTDRLALEPYAALGEAGCARLRELGRPLSEALTTSLATSS
jgi:hypothetical protein